MSDKHQITRTCRYPTAWFQIPFASLSSLICLHNKWQWETFVVMDKQADQQQQ